MAAQGYRAQLPGSVVKRVVDRQPGVGEAIVGGLQQLGQAAQQYVRIQQQRDRGAAVADGMGRLAELQLATEEEIQKLRDSSAPGGGDTAAKAEEIYRQKWQEFTGTLGDDPEVRQHFAPMGARWMAAGIGQSRDWERQQRVKYLGDQFQASLDTNAAGLFAQPTVDSYDALIADNDSAIDMQTIDGNAKANLKLLVRQKLTSALFEGTLAQGNSAAVSVAIGTGKFDQWIGGADGKARWLDRAQAVGDAQVRQQEANASEARRTAEDALEALQARIDVGEDVTQADIETALASAKSAGVDAAKMIRFAGLGEKAASRAFARGLTTREIEAQVTALGAKRSGGKATPADLRTLEQLDNELDARADKGAESVAELWKGGPDQQAGAVAQLHGMKPSERWRVAQKVGGNIGEIASLHPRVAQVTLRGSAIRKERPNAFMPPNDKGEGQPAEARKVFNTYVGLPTVNALGGRYEAILNTAMDLYVGSMANLGGSGAWDQREFGNAVQIVFGRSLRPDGTKQGGLGLVRGRRVELPSGWTESEFDRGLSGQSFVGATYGDGSQAAKADILANYRPVVDTVDDDGRVHYRFEDARGRALLRAGSKGEPWLLHVARSAVRNPVARNLPSGPPAPKLKGNLPLGIRYRVKNEDGSISTVRTMSIGTDDGEVLIPTVVGGKILDDDDAIAHFRKTGENFGTFKSVKDADAYAEWLHKKHEREMQERR